MSKLSNPLQPVLAAGTLGRLSVMGMVWYGMVLYDMIWYGMVWYGMVWYGMEDQNCGTGLDETRRLR